MDGVRWSHIVAGDVAALASRQGMSEPPITFSVTWMGWGGGRGKTARVKKLTKEKKNFYLIKSRFGHMGLFGNYMPKGKILSAFTFTIYSTVKIPTPGDWKS